MITIFFTITITPDYSITIWFVCCCDVGQVCKSDFALSILGTCTPFNSGPGWSLFPGSSFFQVSGEVSRLPLIFQSQKKKYSIQSQVKSQRQRRLLTFLPHVTRPRRQLPHLHRPAPLQSETLLLDVLLWKLDPRTLQCRCRCLGWQHKRRHTKYRRQLPTLSCPSRWSTRHVNWHS